MAKLAVTDGCIFFERLNGRKRNAIALTANNRMSAVVIIQGPNV
jgi:hypothetical protein